MVNRRRQAGAALMLALIAVALLLTLTTVSLDAFLLSARSAQRMVDANAAFHAADTVLTLCEHRIVQMHRMQSDGAKNSQKNGDEDGSEHVSPVAANAKTTQLTLSQLMATTAEPTGWQRDDAFDAGPDQRSRGILTVALPFTAASAELTAGRCIAERWIDRLGVGRVYLLTVRMPIGGVPVDDRAIGHASTRSDVIGGKQTATARSIARKGPAIWLQSIVEIDNAGSHRHWRAVAEPPI